MHRQTLAFPLVVSFETTTRCNAGCTICPHGTKVGRSGLTMDMPSFEKVVDECVGKSVDHIGLSFYGEPLLDPHIVARVAKVRSTLGVPMGFFTNGSLMTSKVAAELLQAGLRYVSFSIDGTTAESYERIRRGLKYDEVVANVRNFVKLNNSLGRPCRRVRVHMTITEGARREYVRFHEIWSVVEGVDVVSWLNCDGRGGEGKEPALGDGSTIDPCAQPFSALNIQVDGTAVMCCVDYGGDEPLGNAFEDGIGGLWMSAKFERIRRLHNAGRKHEIPLCAGCKTHY